MSNRVVDLTVIAGIDGNERMYIADDPTGTPVDRHVTPDQLVEYTSDELLIDEDSFASNLATKAPSQQSTKAYVDAAVTGMYEAGGTDVAVADGGTGASTAAAARTNLGVAINTDVAASNRGLPAGGTANQVLAKVNGTDYNVEWTDPPEGGGGGEGTVTSVNGEEPVAGDVTIDADDIDDSGTTNKFITASGLSKLSGIEDNADVTDATNVANAGAVMEADTSTASMAFVIDEDSMVSNSATKVPTQQSVKAYVDAGNADQVDLGSQIELTDSDADTFLNVRIHDDSSSSSTWPERFAFWFERAASTFRRVFYLNEYGEPRIIPALTNTVAMRFFRGTNSTDDAARVDSAYMVELMDNRDDRNHIFGVDSVGNIDTAGDFFSSGAYVVHRWDGSAWETRRCTTSVPAIWVANESGASTPPELAEWDIVAVPGGVV